MRRDVVIQTLVAAVEEDEEEGSWHQSPARLGS